MSVQLFALAIVVAGVLVVVRYASQIQDRTTRILGLGAAAKVSIESVRDVNFVFPRFDPTKNRLSDVPPVPYRPFRWGPFHVTMGIRNIGFENWIELDKQHAHYHRLRAHRTRTRGEKLIASLPATDLVPVSGKDAARELVEELAEYLSRRYPNEFSVERHPVRQASKNGWYGEGSIRTITMLPPVGVTYNLDKEDPMTIAGLLVQDDLALMIEGTDGVYYLRAGAIITAGFWRLEDKAGMSLDDIHFSGNVPQYATRLQTSLNRFFQRLPCDKLVQRNNYFFKLVHDPSVPAEPLDPDELGWADYMVGAEDAFAPGRGLGETEEEAEVRVPTPRQMRLRMERQTLRRLPRTGAVCFTIRTYTVPLEEMAAEPGVPGRAASAIRSWPADVAGYKNRAQFEQYVLPYLDECHQKQVEAGLVREDEQLMTDYPY